LTGSLNFLANGLLHAGFACCLGHVKYLSFFYYK
jgi:hypothetical protein